ncbi:bifunctional hydroxymethylpyrimidine kinase/phosphomethylpyrimidine kinase [bacterium]|nr:bifunctional hydroxymethylpyrimidine kinase/phosphomethylpyrimidine kinase [bacterium]
MPRVLSVAGSDSGGGAGIQADLKTFHAMGVYGMTVITAVTAQNTRRVHGIESISSDFIALQFEAVLSDIGVDSVKIGMLFDAAIVRTVAGKLSDAKIPYVIVDPVMISTSGDTLLEESAVNAIKEVLLPQATLITPNMAEAALLADIVVEDIDQMKEAAIRIHRLGCAAVLVKGGHLEGDAVDLLFDGESFITLTTARIDSYNTHGTGCTISAAIAALMAKGYSLQAAVEIAKKYVTEAIRNGFPLGKGHGPLNHFVKVDGMKL